METIQVNNWRIRTDTEYGLMAEISTPAGYVWPDCTYKCKHCGKCLGCIRKTLFVDNDGTPEFIDEKSTLCPISPTSFHEVEDNE